MAKKTFKLDDMEDLTSVIELDIKGKVFTVKTMKQSVLEKVVAIEKVEGISAGAIFTKQLAIFCECDEKELTDLDLDVRQLKAMVTMIMGELQDAGEAQRKSGKVEK